MRATTPPTKWPWRIGKRQEPGLLMLVSLAQGFAIEGMEPAEAWITTVPLCHNRESPYYYEHEARSAFRGLVTRGICTEYKHGWKLSPKACKALGIEKSERHKRLGGDSRS